MHKNVFNNLLIILMFCHSNPIIAGATKSGEPQHFYVGTYTNSGSKGIYSFSLNPMNGKLSDLGLAAESTNPSFLALTPDGMYLLAVNEIADGKNSNMGYIQSFATNSNDHMLRPVSKVVSGGADPCFISVNQAGNVLTANYSGGNVALFHLNKTGELSPPCDIQQHFGEGPIKQRQSQPHVHSSYFEPNSNRIFVADLGTDKVALYNLPEGGTKLEKSEIQSINLIPGSGPRHLVFHPSLKFVYIVNEISNSISVVNLNKDGSFTTIETISTLPDKTSTTNNCADIHISKDGRFLYASNRGINTIAIFSVDPQKGNIRLIGQEPTRGEIPRNFTLSPNEDFLLVANQNSQNIVSFRRNQETGKLEYADQIKALKPVCLLFCK